LFSLQSTLSAPSFPLFTLSSPPSPNLSPHYHSLLLTHHVLTSLLYQLHTTQLPAIPDINTLHYNNRNISKHTKAIKPSNPITLNSPTHSLSHPPPFLRATFTNSQQSRTSLITITPPQLWLFIDIIIRGFSMEYVNNWSGIEPVNLLMLNYTSRPGADRAQQPD
jgi:hypothetical protein